MTWTKGYTPWNKGKKFPLTKCRRHRVTRTRGKGSVYCRLCKIEATKAWNLRNPDIVADARARYRARRAGEKRAAG